jgi:hypothetical protein
MVPYYFYFEKNIEDKKEFLLLVTFPTVGLGRFLYGRASRAGNKEILPIKWYVWDKMRIVNIALLIVVFIVMVRFLLEASGVIGSGVDWASEQDNQNALGFGILMDMGIGVAWFLISIIFGLVYIVIALLVIIIPRGIAGTIKTSYLIEQKRKLKSELEQENPKASSNPQ